MSKRSDGHINGRTNSEDSSSNKDSEEDIISVRCPFYIKEQVDCRDKNGHWRNGEIIRVC